MKPTANIPFWKNWGFWGLLMVASHLPIPYNPVSILLTLLSPSLYFSTGSWLAILGLLFLIVGVIRHPQNRWWSIAGFVIVAIYAVFLLTFLSKF